MATASSGAVFGDKALVEGSMLLMPTAPSVAVTRTTTHLVIFLEAPPLVNVPTRGMPMQNTSIWLIVAVILNLIRRRRPYI
jgi:hypothetical protein